MSNFPTAEAASILAAFVSLMGLMIYRRDGRFEKIQQTVQAFEEKTNRRLDLIEQQIGRRFDKTDEKFEKSYEKFDRLEMRLNILGERISFIEGEKFVETFQNAESNRSIAAKKMWERRKTPKEIV